MDLDVLVGIASTQLLIELGVELGVPAQRLLHSTGIPAEQLLDPFAEVTRRQELTLIRNLVGECPGIPDLGIRAGKRYHLAMHGIWGFIMLTARTGGDALAAAVRHRELIWSFTDVTVHLEGETAVLHLHGDQLPADLRAFVMERAMAGITNLAKEVLGFKLPLVAVHFQHFAPADISSYVDTFGIEPVFGTAVTAFRFHRKYLDAPIPQADAFAYQGYDLACQALVAKRRARTGIAGTVRSVLSTRLDKGVDAVAVAAELRMSPRTLSRKLEQEGTSFRILADEVRETIAEGLLIDAKMSTAQVAQRLGYTDSASFSRAFKRWKGVTPQAFRTDPHALAAS